MTAAPLLSTRHCPTCHAEQDMEQPPCMGEPDCPSDCDGRCIEAYGLWICLACSSAIVTAA